MTIDHYREAQFNVDRETAEIEPDPSDNGMTEIASVQIFHDELEFIRARVSVPVTKEPIPHTEDEKRTFSKHDVDVELLYVDDGEEADEELTSDLLDDSGAIDELERLCSQEDQRDQGQDHDILDT